MTADIPTVKDLVIPIERYPHLQQEQTLHDAVQIIQSYTCGEQNRIRYSEILVLNDHNQLVGCLSIRDVLCALDKRISEVPEVKGFEGKGTDFPNLTILWEDSFFRGCAKGASKPISDCMSPVQTFLKGGDSILKALSILLSTHKLLLPVVENNKVIGVIRLEEIFSEISMLCKL